MALVFPGCLKKIIMTLNLTRLLSIGALVTISVLAGCKKDDDPAVIPTVVSNVPTSNAVNVATSSTVAVVFSVAMDPSTITSTTFTLKQGTTAVAGAVTYSGNTATFTPTVNLEGNKLFSAMVTTGAKSTAGAALAVSHTFDFTTGAAPDILKPTIASTDPISSAINVVRNKVLSIVFSEPMDPTTITSTTFTLKQNTTNVTGTVAYSGTTATFTPTAALSANSAYTASISTGAKDLAGNALAAATTWSFTSAGTTTSLAPVNLGAAGNYLILAKTAINNSSTSALTGDLGLSPAATTYITGLALTNATGFATSSQVTGKIYAADMADPTPIDLTTAVNNMTTAYNDAAGRPSPDFSELGTGNIGGRTLTPGLYKWTNTVSIPSSITISGNATDVWIFQIAGNLSVSSAVNVTLTGGALAKNIFWQVAGQATFGTTSRMEGVILSMTGITFQTGAALNGRALAQTAVILDANTLVKPN